MLREEERDRSGIVGRVETGERERVPWRAADSTSPNSGGLRCCCLHGSERRGYPPGLAGSYVVLRDLSASLVTLRGNRQKRNTPPLLEIFLNRVFCSVSFFFLKKNKNLKKKITG